MTMHGKKKTDNASLPTKVMLRRWLLREMGITRVRVLDACAGAGEVWTAMAAHVEVERWIQCDIKPRRLGQLRMTALETMLRMPLDPFNVIDIDPYGEPWEAYHAAIQRIRTPMAIFLTRGGLVNVVTSNELRELCHLPRSWPVPRTPALAEYLDGRMLSETWQYARVLHAGHINVGGNLGTGVQYYALGLAPL